MPRKVRDAALETRTARHRLKLRKEPYYRLIEPGLHLGYRKLANGPGTWLVRRHNGEAATGSPYTRENLITGGGILVIADDYSDADGKAVLSFGQAQERAKAHRPAAGADDGKPYTVARAMDDYIAFLREHRRTANDAASRNRVHIRPAFGTVEISRLTAKKIRDWLSALAKEPPRLRTRDGEDQKFRKIAQDDETKRRRQASANRTFTVLKAALNYAWREGKAVSDAEWRRVKPFHSVDKARVSYLSIPECKRLLNACPEDFRKMVQAALQTGARWSQLVELTAADFDADRNTVRLRTRKGRGQEKVYRAVLTDEGAGFFAELAAGAAGSGILLRKVSGKPWGRSHQKRPMAEACKQAKISPAVGFHQLRHTWASHAVMNGVPLLVIAGNLGHTDTRMVERHYGHLAPSFVAEAIRAGAPKFGFKPSNVRPLTKR
jgi:integrase